MDTPLAVGRVTMLGTSLGTFHNPTRTADDPHSSSGSSSVDALTVYLRGVYLP